jgi:hypothetical protein
MSWEMPAVWRFYQEEGVENSLTMLTQRFELDANGTSRIKKDGMYCGTRNK